MANLVGRILGNYRVVARLGRGGMAEVYKGHQPGLDRYVGIKVLHAHLVDEEGFVGRFEREAQAIARLRHPNIVQVIELDQEGEVYFMAMEFIDGPTLKDELKARKAQNKPLSFVQTSLVFTALCSAIDYAHKNGMVHRDIKPANVMINEEGQVILTDFGIARIMGATQYTQTGALSGTPAYMSPEQGQGDRGDERSDIYALGVMLYEMATGMVPYDADTPFAVIMKHISEPLPPPSQINPDIPEAVEQVIITAMQKEPDNRYQTAGEMARALREAVQVSPYETLQSSPLTTIAPPPKFEQIEHPTGPITEAERTYSAVAPADAATVWSSAAGATAVSAPVTRQLSPIYIGVGAVVLILIVGGIIATLALSSTSSGAEATETAVALAVGATETAEQLATTAARGAAENRATQTAEAATVAALAPTQTAEAGTVEAERSAGRSAFALQTSTAEAAKVQTAVAEGVASANTATAEVVAAFTATPTSTPTDTPQPTDTPLPPSPTPTRTPTPAPVVVVPTNTPTPVIPTATPTPARPNVPGGKLAFPVDDGGGRYDVFIVSMPDGNLISQVRGARQPNYRSDGQKLLLNGEGGGFGENVWEANGSGNIERPVSGSPMDLYPFYKDDGTTLAYSNPQLATGAQGRNTYMFVQCSLRPPTDESDDQCRAVADFQIIVPSGNVGDVIGSHPVWTFPGDRIAYKGCNTWAGGGRCGMYIVGSWSLRKFSGENPILLVDGSSTTPTDARQGRIAFMSRETGDWEAFVIPETGGTPTNISNSSGSQDGVPTISPDGNWVAFATNREGAWAIWVASADGSQPAQKLFDFPKANPWGTGDHDWSNERMSWGP